MDEDEIQRPGDLSGSNNQNSGLSRRLSGKGICVRYRRHTGVQPLGGEEPLEEEMATHSSILAWKIPLTEESGRL